MVERRQTASIPVDVWQEINELNSEFAYRVDCGVAETTADLFVADGSYVWGEKKSMGREAIRMAYRLRAARGIRTVRHLCTNLRLRMITEDEISGLSIMLIFGEDGPPPHPAVPLLVADVDDIYVRENGKWFFR